MTLEPPDPAAEPLESDAAALERAERILLDAGYDPNSSTLIDLRSKASSLRAGQEPGVDVFEKVAREFDSIETEEEAVDLLRARFGALVAAVEKGLILEARAALAALKESK